VTHSDHELLQCLAHGDMAALGDLYDRHARRVYHVLLARGLEVSEADEVLPEVFLALAERGRKLRQVQSALGYLLGIARHLAHRVRKARTKGVTASPAGVADRGLPPRPAEPAVASTAAVAPGPEGSLAVVQLLRQLPPEQAEVVALKVWHGFTFGEIGQALAVSPNTAASRYRYGIEKLKGMWEEE